MPLTVDSTVNPIKVTGTTDTSAVIVASGNLVKIKFIYWLQPTTIGHKLALQDGEGNDIVELYCDVANKPQWAPIFTTYDGLYSDDMDSGTLYIYRR